MGTILLEYSNPEYSALLTKLFSMRRSGRRRSLEGINALLLSSHATDIPYPCIQIAGTNGKGSTAAMLSSILEASGYRTGLFTSPHLIHFRERFRVQGNEARDEDLYPILKLLLNVSERLGFPILFFEIVTALALLFFAQEKVDVGIFEVGIGGRLDPTSVVPSCISVLTSIGLDHTQILGDDLFKIAKEKAGIFRPHVPVVSCVTQPEIIALLQTESVRLNTSTFLQYGVDFCFEEDRDSFFPQIVSDRDTKKKKIPPFMTQGTFLSSVMSPLTCALYLPGEFQKRNLSAAIMAAHLWCKRNHAPLSSEHIQIGAFNVRWPGRMQIISFGQRRFLLDGAHNREAIFSLVSSLPQATIHLVFGCMEDKSVESLIEPLLAHAETVHFCPARSSRSCCPKTLLQKTLHFSFSGKIQSHESVNDAIEQSILCSQEDEWILVTGSLYIIGEALSHLQE